MKLFKDNQKEYTTEGLELSMKITKALEPIVKEYYNKVENKCELQSVLTNTVHSAFIFAELFYED
jgi:hypothetical protein